MEIKEILQQLAPHSILVGSASYSPLFRDIDLVVSAKGLSVAKKIFPPNWVSGFIGSITTFETEPPIEVFRHWYGPDYHSLKRRKLPIVKLFDVEFRAWPDSAKIKERS